MDTEKVLQEMLTENTGRHFLDSGGAYGRHWERNQARQFENEPEASLCGRYGYLDVTVNVYHFLKSRVEYNPNLQREYDSFAQDSDDSHLADMENFMEHLRESGREIGGIYGDGEPMTVNTYNGEDLLSQTLQYIYWTDEDGPHILLQIHGGCDVRGGYTAPKCFDVVDYDGTGIFDNSRASVHCTGDRQDRDQLNLLTGKPDDPCGFVLDLDGGYVQDMDCNTVELGFRDRDDDDSEDPEAETVLEYDDDGLYCPHCGSTLAASPWPC